MATTPQVKALYLDIFRPLLEPHRYKVLWGGRGGMKTWSVARALIQKAHMQKHRIACLRELQTSIKDSVHQTLKDQIEMLRMGPYFDVTEKAIRSKRTKTEFLFKGLRTNIGEIKSTEGITIAWVEEANLVSKRSWETLVPTVRAPGSEIWITFNPEQEEDPTYQNFVLHPPADAWVRKVGWEDNPWFPDTLNKERLSMLERDPDGYEHVWGGSCRTITDAMIFRNRYVIDSWETPTDPPPARFFHGADWGFANDPTALIRYYTTEEPAMVLANGRKIPAGDHLWIDQEAVGYGVELEDIPDLFDQIPTSRVWPIKADCSRPETISFVGRKGFDITPAEKWDGCVEDGIAHLKGFRLIHIHQRCTHTGREARLYRFKVDRVTQQVLPIIVDANNHCFDAIRYGLDGYIQRRGVDAVWARL
jgi:phage terminase large subunit